MLRGKKNSAIKYPTGMPSPAHLFRVGNSRTARNELHRVVANSIAKTSEAPHDKRDMTAKQPGIHVQLVDDDKLEVDEEPAPLLFARQNSQVQHVWICEDLDA